MSGAYLTIGICGREGAGKDTVGGVLHALGGFHTAAFADPLRAEVAAAFSVDPRMFTARDRKASPDIALAIGRCGDARFITAMHALGREIGSPRGPREIMQLWGTEYRRQLDGSLYWISRMEDRLDQMHRLGLRKIALTDVRFPNEAALVRARGGQIWRVHRSIADRAPATHASEQLLDDIKPEVTIDNNGDMDALVREVSLAYMGALEAA